MKTAYYEIGITPHHSGFGMWELGNRNYSPEFAYADLTDLEQAMRDGGCDDLLLIDEALTDTQFIVLGVIDIRGRIYGGNPALLYVARRDSELQYCGIETCEVPANYWAQQSRGR